MVLNKKKRIFYTGDLLERKAVSREVKREIQKAKINYKNKVEIIFSTGDIRAACLGLKSMAAINEHADKSKQHIGITGVTDTDLSNTFNAFFSLFERSDFTNNITRVILLFLSVIFRYVRIRLQHY